jgi:hypothetical protein
MARHCSDHSIGKSVRRLMQNPRGRRPSIAASARREEREGQRHLDRALALARAGSERLDRLGGIRQSSSGQRRASRNALMKPSRAFVHMVRKGCCASPWGWTISRRRRQDGRSKGTSAPVLPLCDDGFAQKEVDPPRRADGSALDCLSRMLLGRRVRKRCAQPC